MSELNILFATNFSDSCFRAIRAVAQLADAINVRLTVAHANHGGLPRHRDLHSFFAEADHFGRCRRVTLDGSPVEGIVALSRQERFDLIISPGSDRLGLPRPFHRSIRAGLLQAGTAPVWTTSRGLEEGDFRRPIRTVAVAMDGWDSNLQHLHLASAFAERVGARLHLLTVVPDIHEGTLVSQAVAPQPLHPDRAIARLEKLLAGWHRVPVIDAAVGSASRHIPRMAAKCDADLLFLSQAQSTSGVFIPGISRTVNHAPCAVVSVPAALPASFRWSFQTPVAAPAAALLDTVYA
ncbi:MAG: universal stress protein [Bryobacterales bacterium]|nr:universal stress protein [Bryobacterales bacterium]